MQSENLGLMLLLLLQLKLHLVVKKIVYYFFVNKIGKDFLELVLMRRQEKQYFGSCYRLDLHN